jgi:hypothetical protein
MISLGAGLPGSGAVRHRSISGDLDPNSISDTLPRVLFIHANADRLVPYPSAVEGASAFEQSGGQE